MSTPEQDPTDIERQIQELRLSIPDDSSDSDFARVTHAYLAEAQHQGFIDVANNVAPRLRGGPHLGRAYFELISSESAKSMYVRRRSAAHDSPVQITYNHHYRVAPLFKEEELVVEDYLLSIGEPRRIAMTAGTLRRQKVGAAWGTQERTGPFLQVRQGKLGVIPLNPSYTLNFPIEVARRRLFNADPSDVANLQLAEAERMRQNGRTLATLLQRLRELPSQTRRDDITY